MLLFRQKKYAVSLRKQGKGWLYKQPRTGAKCSQNFHSLFYAFVLQPTTLEVYALNDTRQQLMVHWAGENSRVIICLAKDRVISSTPDGGAKFLRPSTVYISYDFGSTYKNKTDHFKLDDSQNSSYANLDKFYNHNKFSSHVSFRLCVLKEHLMRIFFAVHFYRQ
jgi:hypothetical protein